MFMFYLSMLETPEEKLLIEQLYSQYRQMMYKISFSILKDSFDAQDAVHNTFIGIIRSSYLLNLSDVNSRETKAYIITAVKHSAIKIYNKRKSVITEDIDEHFELESDESVEETALSAVGVEEIKAALSELSDNDYEVLYLSVFGQKSNDEIAKLLEINPETARKKVYRARQRLAQKITEKRGVAV